MIKFKTEQGHIECIADVCLFLGAGVLGEGRHGRPEPDDRRSLKYRYMKEVAKTRQNGRENKKNKE